MRAVMSMPPPAANGTTSLIGRDGKSDCASAADDGSAASASPANAAHHDFVSWRFTSHADEAFRRSLKNDAGFRMRVSCVISSGRALCQKRYPVRILEQPLAPLDAIVERS